MPRMRIWTWNVLADAYVRADRYPDTPTELLEPTGRRQAISEALRALDADVVCLQEAEQPLAAALAEDWHVEWCPKDGRPDGCALLVRPDWTVVATRRHAFAGVTTGGHVAQLVTIATGRNADRITIANTHLRWSPPGDTDDAHLGAIQLAELLDVIAECRHGGPVVAAGDFNDLPAGPARRLLTAAGFTEAHPRTPSVVVDGRIDAVDVLAARGARLRALAAATPTYPMPRRGHPSDHVALGADVTW